MKDALVIEVVRKTITVDCAVEEAFRVFTADAISWWPVESHSIHETVGEIVFEQRPAARSTRSPSGERGYWATVLEWDPPSRLVLAWNILRADDSPTEVEVRFLPEEAGTESSSSTAPGSARRRRARSGTTTTRAGTSSWASTPARI